MFRRTFLYLCLLLLLNNAYSQKLSQVGFSQASNFSWFSIITNQNILIRISDDGQILQFGTEQTSLYGNYFAPNLIPFSGSINYYQNGIDYGLNGKIKNIGACFFTYYGSNDYPEKVGKIKTAGNLFFDYYRQYGDALTAGKIQTIGTATITWYNSMDNDALKGKLKSVGKTVIDYYSSFDDPYLKGKLKTIGGYKYNWSTVFNGREFQTILKTGNQRQVINGITFVPE